MADRLAAPADDGAVTAELAVAMPSLTVVLAALLSVAQVVLAQVDCVDAARAGARAAARGESGDVVRRAVTDAASGGSREAATSPTVVVDRAGGLASVTVTRSVRLLSLGPQVHVTARAVAQDEGLTATSLTPWRWP